MSATHLNLLFPQWQGGGPDISTYYGAKEFQALYLNQISVTEIEVNTQKSGEVAGDIFEYTGILRQMERAHDRLKTEAPKTVFTLGGSCDADVPSVAYLNRRYGDMTLLWIDAHGDLNTPASSPSKYFYGMPVRTLIGEGDGSIVKSLPSTLSPGQVILMGTRDLDPGEQLYIESRAIPVLSVSDIEKHSKAVFDVIRSRGSANLYIHVDLDVLEPTQFPYVPLPVPAGLCMETLQSLLNKLNAEFNVVGLGLMECQPTGNQRYPLLEEISRIGTGLSRNQLYDARNEQESGCI